MSEIHPQARTTPLTRAEIKASSASLAELAQRYNVSLATIRKWKSRETPEDRSHRPHTLSTTLAPAQEVIVVELRRLLLLPLDDLLVITREFINPQVSRSGLDRCLRRHGVANLRELQAALASEDPAPPKTFKDYEPGFVHVDIKYLPQMPDESARRYLFVAIDRATRWVYLRIYAHQSEASSTDFLRRLHQVAPMKIKTVLTDNGSQFTDRFTSKTRIPSGSHAFDRQCKALDIEHRLCPPQHPQTNGMVERFNGRISELIGQTRFLSAQELKTTLTHYLATYNHRIPQPPSTTYHPSRPSNNGTPESLGFLLSGFMNRRDLTSKLLPGYLASPSAFTIHMPCKDNPNHYVPSALIPLYDDGKAGWFEAEPVSSLQDARIDLAALKFKDLDTTDGPRVTPIEDFAPGPRDFLLIGRDVVIVGYPFGIAAENPYPIWKRGYVASEPSILIGGLPKFYIDTPGRPGMSGSPIFMMSHGVGLPKKTAERLNNPGAGGGLQALAEFDPEQLRSAPDVNIMRFAGVYSGSVGDQSLEKLNLGVAWHAALVDRLFSNPVQGSNPFPPFI